MRLLRGSLFIWLANRLPNFFFLRYVKALFLLLAGVKLKLRGIYFLSSINIDRPWKVSMGNGVFINRNCTFEGLGEIVIGANVQIGPNVVLATTNHQLGQMDEIFGDIKIMDNVWIGANVVIVQGVTIGPNVTVGAGSVVTKNFRDCTVGGVPARVINQHDK